jgi:hypothetical protein
MRWFLMLSGGLARPTCDVDQLQRQLRLAQCSPTIALRLGVDGIHRRGLDGRLVHAVLAHRLRTRLANSACTLFSNHLAEVGDEAHRVGDLQADDGVEVERHAVAGHQVVEVDAVLLRHHRDVDGLVVTAPPTIVRPSRRDGSTPPCPKNQGL